MIASGQVHRVGRRDMLQIVAVAVAGAAVGCGDVRPDDALAQLWPVNVDSAELARLARRLAVIDPALIEEAESLRVGRASSLSLLEVRVRTRDDALNGRFVVVDAWFLPRFVAVLVVATFGD